MALDEEFLKQIIETFKAELDERLQAITDGLLALENGKLHDDELDKVLDEIFRSAHNIKGSARGIGVSDVGDIAHNVETLFTAIRKKIVLPNPDVINLCLQSVDNMREAMQCFSQKIPLPFDLPDLLKRLEKEATPSSDAKAKEVPETKSEPGPEAPSDISPEPQPEIISAPQEKMGTEQPAEPAKTTAQEPAEPKHKAIVESSEYETIRVSLHNLDRVSAYMEEMQINKIAIDEHFIELVSLNSKAKQFFQAWKKSLFDLKSLYNKELGDNLQKLYDVNADRLIDITSLINKMHKNMTSHINELTMLSNSLQEEVRLLRLVPASTLLRNLPRTVRDLANNLKKQVELEIKDKDAKIDKIVLEGIKDPIIHILRNAIDHGIETPAWRKEHGKPETGHIQIDVKEEGNYVAFIIKDDGGGIDPEKVANSALKKNLISKSELALLSNHEIINLIFRPGFSTKEIITDVSGRGVGLDVVSSNLAHLKGEVSLTTEIGLGTTFRLRVPLTLATDRGLIVECGGQLFVIATSSIERVLLLNKQDIVEVEMSQAILLDKHPVSLCALSDILELGTKSTIAQNKLPIVVIKAGQNTAAFLVDSIIGEREIVIKPLQAPLTNVSCVAGATLSGSGEIIVVLNLTDVMDKAIHSRKNIIAIEDAEITQVNTKPTLLLVDDSATTRSFIQGLLTNRGYQVEVAVDGQEAWDLLQKRKFNLLITDVEMPNMNGFELTDRVKKSATLHSMPVIIITSLENEAHKKRGTEVGADAYIVKKEFESGGLAQIVGQMVYRS